MPETLSFRESARWSALCAALILALVISGGTAVAASPPGAPGARHFGPDEGILSSNVGELSIDRRGYLWAAHSYGAAYYDGATWRNFAIGANERDYVRQVMEGSDGSRWFIVEWQLRRWKDGAWIFYPAPGEVAAIVEHPVTRKAWAIANGAVREYDGQRWKPSGSRSLPPGRARMIEATNNGLLVATESGLFRERAGRWSFVAPRPGNRWEGLVVTRDSRGGEVVWTYFDRAHLARLVNGGWLLFNSTNSPIPRNPLWAIAAGRKDNGEHCVWIGTDEGELVEYAFEKGAWRIFDRSNSDIPPLRISSILPHQGQLWLSFPSGGVVALRTDGWRQVHRRNAPFQSDVVNSMLHTSENGEDVRYFGTEDGLMRWAGGKWESIGEAQGLPSRTIWALYDRQHQGEHELWVGTSKGIARRRGGRWTIFTERNSGLRHHLITTMIETTALDGQRRLVLGTNFAGIAIVTDDDKIVHIDTDVPKERANVWAMAETFDDKNEPSLWLGFHLNGMRRVRGKKVESFTPENSPLLSHMVRAIVRDRDGRSLWVGTSKGAMRVVIAGDKLEWQPAIQLAPGSVLDRDVTAITTDERGRIYFATAHGVTRLTPARNGLFTHEQFTRQDGLPSNDCTTHAMSRDSDGNIWVGTTAGAAWIDGKGVLLPPPPRPLLVEEIRINGIPTSLNGSALFHDRNDVTFTAKLLSFDREADTRYQTQLVGYDPAPSEWTQETSRIYTNLPAGGYRFVVRARDGYGVVATTAPVKFKIKRAPWFQWWAILLYALALVALVNAFIRWRLSATRRRNAELEQTVTERTSELADAVERLKISENEAHAAKDVAVRLSATDALTGIANRRRFVEVVEEEMRLAQRYGSPLSLVMLDIDHFKSVNDRFGHDVGDMVLVHVAQTLLHEVRATDLVARWGGEEFMVLLRQTAAENAQQIAEKIRERLASSPCIPVGTVTGSFGVTQYQPPETLLTMTSRCDELLYEAKRSGRNRVVA